MGLFDFFKRRSSPLSGDDLREALITAVEGQDRRALSRLCEQNQQTIRKWFPTWRKVPEEIKKDPMAVNRYCQGLIGVASLFEKAGDQSLITLLAGDEADNPITAWERDLSGAQSLIDDGQAGQAIELLETVLSRAEELRGPHYFARTFGMLGAAFYRSGDSLKAVEFTRRAKALCEELGDEEGVRIYAGNLQYITKGPAEAPKLILRDDLGRELLEDDLENFTGKVKWEIVDGQKVSSKAQELHSLARREGQIGNYAKALELLEQARKEAPGWPYPVYDKAFTYLLIGDSDSALENYEAVVRMAPRGFFTAITALHYLRCEKSGELKPGTYRAYLMLEGIGDPAEKRTLLESMVKRTPTFAPAWNQLASLLEDESARLEAIEMGLSQEPDEQTEGSLLINKALIFDRHGKHDEAIRMLGELARDPRSPPDVAMKAKLTLRNITRRPRAGGLSEE